jgi:hypothetical protein
MKFDQRSLYVWSVECIAHYFFVWVIQIAWKRIVLIFNLGYIISRCNDTTDHTNVSWKIFVKLQTDDIILWDKSFYTLLTGLNYHHKGNFFVEIISQVYCLEFGINLEFPQLRFHKAHFGDGRKVLDFVNFGMEI